MEKRCKSFLLLLIAFLIYLVLVGLLALLGKKLAGHLQPYNRSNPAPIRAVKQRPPRLGAPGYRPFFVVALFFAVLHLGVLVMSTGSLSR